MMLVILALLSQALQQLEIWMIEKHWRKQQVKMEISMLIQVTRCPLKEVLVEEVFLSTLCLESSSFSWG